MISAAQAALINRAQTLAMEISSNPLSVYNLVRKAHIRLLLRAAVTKENP